MVKILIIDRQSSIRNILKEKLKFEGYSVEAVEELELAHSAYENFPFEVIIAEEEAFSIYIQENKSFAKSISIIVTSTTPTIDNAVNSIRLGAFDFISKPIDMNYLLTALKRLHKEAPEDGVDRRAKVATAPPARTTAARTTAVRNTRNGVRVEDIIGDSDSIGIVKELIDKVAPSDARVLVMGPNGTGKELVARWLHEKSHRCDAPFVEVNCAAIPSELIESELFGHEKGAFTSAIKQRKGKFEQANGGTLFLDEIGDMSLSAQAKVLRVLQENRLSRVGSDKDFMVDVRVVAATNKCLREEIEKGNFREDLYHRLSVIVINVPPLIERKEDIPMLVNHFVKQISAEYGWEPKLLDSGAIEYLKTMDWTGNIRELRNVIERLMILCDSDNITSADVRTHAHA